MLTQLVCYADLVCTSGEKYITFKLNYTEETPEEYEPVSSQSESLYYDRPAYFTSL